MQLTEENKAEIKSRFQEIETVEQLAELIQKIYEWKFPVRSEKMNVVIEAKHLNFYAFQPLNRYKEFSIPKKSKKGVRTISAPRYKLKTIQKCINEILNTVSQPHFTAVGFVPKKSIVDNAKVHIGKQFVYNIDLKDFFPSTSFRRIKTVLGLAPFNLTDENEKLAAKEKRKVSTEKTGRGYLAFVIANLCCDKEALPQGAPTSPTLTNIVCQRLDKKLFRLAKEYKATYTRYADDITFSSNKPIFEEEFKNKLKDIVEVQENFKINYDKERIQNQRERQSVTGIVVNKKSNVDRQYLIDVRFWLYCWKRYGTEKTQQKFLQKFPDKKGFQRYGGSTPQFYHYLSGKILFLKMVRGNTDEIFLKFHSAFQTLYEQLQGKPKQQQKEFVNFKELLEKTIATENRLLQTLSIWQKQGIDNAINFYK